MKTELRISLALFGAATLASAAVASDKLDLKPLPSGAAAKIGSYYPLRIELSATKPDGITKAPEAKNALYGELKLGSIGKQKSFFIMLDEPAGEPAKLYVDANANGDLTDDASTTWTARKYGENTQYMGSFVVNGEMMGQDSPVSFQCYRFDPTDKQREALKMTLFYHPDYALQGTLQLGKKKYNALVIDDMATGDLSGKTGEKAVVSLAIDRDGDGRFDRRYEFFDVTKPFSLNGKSYMLSDIKADGMDIKLKRSPTKVAEIPVVPTFHVGGKVASFKAKTMDGKNVSFPSSYKGKVVMLDFWATWCGPCIAELPNVIDNYTKYHDQGFEILGITFDQPNMAEKVKSFAEEHKMPWAQVYEGKFWSTSIGTLYGVNAIPQAYIVDGDTGEILASGEAIRGEGLGKALDKAFAKKATKRSSKK